MGCRNLGNDTMNLNKEPNKRRSDEQASRNTKHLDKLNENVTNPNKPSYKKMRIV